jgi:2-keto-4-pentenoate hydratase
MMMMMTVAELDAAAEELAAAERECAPVQPLTERLPAMDTVDAYEIQRRNIARRLAAGATIRGHKVGLTSLAMQQMLGVDEPDYGHLLDDMFVFEGTSIEAGRLCAPRVEPEVAFVLDQPLSGPGCSVADVLRATRFLLPAIEVIDSRIADWRIKLADTVADNASSARVVLGGSAVRPRDCDPRTLGVVLRRNGEIVETGASGAVLGNPAASVAWLANKLHEFGVSLEAGHVVMPGACTRAVDVCAGDAVRADFDVLGHVSVRFA